MEHNSKLYTKLLPVALMLLCAGMACLAIYENYSKHQSVSWNAEEAWRYNTDSPIITRPLLTGEYIIVRTSDEIISLDKDTGNVRWEVPSKVYKGLMDTDILPRKLAGNSEYLITSEELNSLGIYSMATGSRLWSTATSINFVDSIQTVNNTLIVARHDEDLTVYDLDSKRKLWDIKVPSRMNLSIAANTNVVAFAAEHFLKVYDLVSGELLETTSYPDAVMGELILDGPTLFLVYNPEDSEGLNIDSLQLDSLTKNWTYHVGVIGHPYLYAANHQLYLYDQVLISLDENTGRLLWKEDTQDAYSKPVAYGNYLYFVSTVGTNKNLCKVEAVTGKLDKCTNIGKVALFNSTENIIAPMVVDNMLIISHNEEIVAYRIAE